MPLFRTCVFSSQVVVDHSLTCYPKEVTVCSLADPSNSSPKQKQRPPHTHTHLPLTSHQQKKLKTRSTGKINLLV